MFQKKFNINFLIKASYKTNHSYHSVYPGHKFNIVDTFIKSVPKDKDIGDEIFFGKSYRVIKYSIKVGTDIQIKKAYIRPALAARRGGKVFFTRPLLKILVKDNLDKKVFGALYDSFRRDKNNRGMVLLLKFTKTKNMYGLTLKGALKFIFLYRAQFVLSYRELAHIIDAIKCRFGKSPRNFQLLWDFLFKYRNRLYNNKLFLSNVNLVICGWSRNLLLKTSGSLVDFEFGRVTGRMLRRFNVPNLYLTYSFRKNKEGVSFLSKKYRVTERFIGTKSVCFCKIFSQLCDTHTQQKLYL